MHPRAEQSVRRETVDLERLDKFENRTISEEDRFLTEVDHLNANRLPDGSHGGWTLSEQFKNLLGATKEAAMPYAVNRTEHEYREYGGSGERDGQTGTFMWLGKTAVENAMSGRRYHRHPAALERVEVEIDEARASSDLRPGITKVFISPRMTDADAPHGIAKDEHLADDDSVRISRAVAGGDGMIQKRVMESLLFRDIPLQAWVDLLADPDNIFGRSIRVRDDGSAVSVMEVHRELEVEDGALENGVIGIMEEVVPYIKEDDLRASAERQLERFYESQEDMHAKALNIAKRWQAFEVGLADSLNAGVAVPAIRGFINSMQSRWGDKDLEVILDHQLPDGRYGMSRQLAYVLEKAKQNLLWTRAGIVTGNEQVVEQIDSGTAARLYRDEMYIQVVADNGSYDEVRELEAETDRAIAGYNIRVGGGCPGESSTDFRSDGSSGEAGIETSGADMAEENRIGKVSKGRCVIESCPTRPGEVLVGGCGVCLGRCQKLFDRGKDPSKMRPVPVRLDKLKV